MLQVIHMSISYQGIQGCCRNLTLILELRPHGKQTQSPGVVGVKRSSNISWSETPEPVRLPYMGENFFVNVIKLTIWGWGDYPALSEWMVNVISGAYKRGKGGCDYKQKRRGPQEGSRGKGTQKEKMLHWP